jgi:hypothetical protein
LTPAGGVIFAEGRSESGTLGGISRAEGAALAGGAADGAVLAAAAAVPVGACAEVGARDDTVEAKLSPEPPRCPHAAIITGAASHSHAAGRRGTIAALLSVDRDMDRRGHWQHARSGDVNPDRRASWLRPDLPGARGPVPPAERTRKQFS